MMKKKTTILMITLLALFLMSGNIFADQPLKGFVRYHEDPSKPLPGIEVGLYQDGALIATTVTEQNGKYTFDNIPAGVYTVREMACNLETGGLDTDDLALIQSMVGQTSSTCTNYIEFLAADLVKDNIINDLDVMYWESHYPNNFNPEWVYESTVVDHNGTKTNVPTMGGSSSGDVNGTFVPTGRTGNVVETAYFAKHFTREFNIEINAAVNRITSMGLVINYPEGIDIKGVTSQLGELDQVRIESDRIVIIWSDNKPFTPDHSLPIVNIQGSANKSYNGNDVKFTVTDYCHFVSNGEVIRPEFSVPYLTVSSNDYLSHCYPNPADDVTRIFFNLPCNSKTQLNIYSLTGQLIRTIINEEMSSGQHSVEIPVAELREGVYFYSLTTSGEIKINQSKRLVVVH